MLTVISQGLRNWELFPRPHKQYSSCLCRFRASEPPLFLMWHFPGKQDSFLLALQLNFSTECYFVFRTN